MIFKAIVNEQTFSIEVPEDFLVEGADFFQKMDADMDQGWQMSRKWVEHPDTLQRCQIVADKMLTALENENKKMTMLMAAYILKRMPALEAIDIDTTGDMNSTELIMSKEH